MVRRANRGVTVSEKIPEPMYESIVGSMTGLSPRSPRDSEAADGQDTRYPIKYSGLTSFEVEGIQMEIPKFNLKAKALDHEGLVRSLNEKECVYCAMRLSSEVWKQLHTQLGVPDNAIGERGLLLMEKYNYPIHDEETLKSWMMCFKSNLQYLSSRGNPKFKAPSPLETRSAVVIIPTGYDTDVNLTLKLNGKLTESIVQLKFKDKNIMAPLDILNALAEMESSEIYLEALHADFRVCDSESVLDTY